MEPHQKVLFLCSLNRMRSPTAERVFACAPGLDVRSAGLDDGAARRCTADDLQWADLVVVMEDRHRRALGRQFGPLLRGSKPIVLGIPDHYDVMQPALVDLLLAKVPQFLHVSVDAQAVRACLDLNAERDGLPALSTSLCW